MFSSILDLSAHIRRAVYALTGKGGEQPTPPPALVFLDTETSGLNALDEGGLRHEVIEFSMIIERHGEVVKRMTVKVLPERHVDPKAAELNGYTPEGWANALTKAEAMKAISGAWWKHACVKYEVPEYIDRNGKRRTTRWLMPHVVVQNVRFDMHYLDTWFQSEGAGTLPVGGTIDTVAMATRLKTPSHRMDFLRQWLGWSGAGAHTAEVDTVQLRELYHFLRDASPLRLFIAGVLGRWRTAVAEVPKARG